MDQSISCIVNETLCFEGRGYCDEASSQCLCNPGYVQSGEVIDLTYCSVHVVTGRTVNGLAATVWGLSAVGALVGVKVMQRKEPHDETWEKKLLLCISIFSAMYCTAMALIATSEPYGARTLGNNVAVTVIYSLAMALGWAFLILKPVICKSGLSASVFTYLTSGRDLYARLSPLMVTASSVTALSALLLLSPNTDHRTVVSSIYVLDAIIAILVSLFLAFAVQNLRSNIRTALAAAHHELGTEQRQRLLRFSRRSTVVICIFFVTTLGSALGYAILGADFELARRYTWIVHPILFLVIALWSLRHVINNIRLSLIIKARGLQTSKVGGDNARLTDENIAAQSQQEELGDRSVTISRATRSVSPFSSRKKQRKLKGIKRKPLELMSSVTERTAEGTVLFTHVDGVETTVEATESGPFVAAMDTTTSEEPYSSV